MVLPVRIIPLVLSVALTLAACSQSPGPSGNDSEDTQPPAQVQPTPVPTPPTPTPPVDEPVEPPSEEPAPPPDESPAPPPEEEPPSQPVEPAPPADEPDPVEPPAQPAPPPSEPAPPSAPAPTPPADEPQTPAELNVTQTPGGAAPWTVAYDWTAPKGVKVTYKCDGYDHSMPHLGRVDCHHTAAGQGLTLTLTSPDGATTTQRIDGKVTAPEGGVPYAGEWTTYGPYGEVTFTISEKGSGTSGISADGQNFISLNSDGTLSIGLYGATVEKLVAGEPFGQSGELSSDGAWEDTGEPLWGVISRGP